MSNVARWQILQLLVMIGYLSPTCSGHFVVLHLTRNLCQRGLHRDPFRRISGKVAPSIENSLAGAMVSELTS